MADPKYFQIPRTLESYNAEQQARLDGPLPVSLLRKVKPPGKPAPRQPGPMPVIDTREPDATALVAALRRGR